MSKRKNEEKISSAEIDDNGISDSKKIKLTLGLKMSKGENKKWSLLFPNNDSGDLKNIRVLNPSVGNSTDNNCGSNLKKIKLTLKCIKCNSSTDIKKLFKCHSCDECICKDCFNSSLSDGDIFDKEECWFRCDYDDCDNKTCGDCLIENIYTDAQCCTDHVFVCSSCEEFFPFDDKKKFDNCKHEYCQDCFEAEKKSSKCAQ